jgi:hypothetical protein
MNAAEQRFYSFRSMQSYVNRQLLTVANSSMQSVQVLLALYAALHAAPVLYEVRLRNLPLSGTATFTLALSSG